jgi:hypothetical protein
LNKTRKQIELGGRQYDGGIALIEDLPGVEIDYQGAYGKPPDGIHFRRVLRSLDAKPLISKDFAHELPDDRIVLHDQNGCS